VKFFIFTSPFLKCVEEDVPIPKVEFISDFEIVGM
jgi:hypothetical protein